MAVAAAVAGYAFLSDCQTAALVDATGPVVWWPGESVDGPSVLTRCLDEDAGHFDLRSVGPLATGRRHLPGTLVLESVHPTADATLVAHDCLAISQLTREDGLTPSLGGPERLFLSGGIDAADL